MTPSNREDRALKLIFGLVRRSEIEFEGVRSAG